MFLEFTKRIFDVIFLHLILLFRSYMAFLTSASIIWTENEREEVHSMAIKYGPKGLATLCKSAKLEVSSNKRTVEYHPEIGVNDHCEEEVSNKEKIEEIEGGQGCSDGKSRVCGNGKEEAKDVDSDDPSIIFVEEVGWNADVVKTAKNMHSLLKEASGNLAKASLSKFLNSEDNEFISGSPGLLHYSLPKCKKLSMDEKPGFLEKGVGELAKPNNSFLLGDRVDSDTPLSSSPLPPCAAPNPDVMDHLNDSIESLLKKLSPIKPLPSHDEEFSSPAACFSGQAMNDNLLGDLSPEKLLISPNSEFKPEEIRSSRKSLVKTKSSPEFSFIPKKSSSPLLSALSLLDRAPVLHKDVSSSPEKKRTRVAAFKRQASTPEVPTNRLVRRLEELDSNVKILKTKDITPMPVYDLMNDKELKVFILFSFSNSCTILFDNRETMKVRFHRLLFFLPSSSANHCLLCSFLDGGLCTL